MRQLVQVKNPVTGLDEWCEVATGQVTQQSSRRSHELADRVNVGELLFAEAPHLHDKLLNGRGMTWPEISACADVVLRAVSQDSLRLMFGSKSMREIKRAIETMILAQKLCKHLNPRLDASSATNGATPPAASATQNSMLSLLTLPGKR